MPDLKPLRETLPRVSRLIDQGLDRLHPGAQLYVSRRGRPVVNDAHGNADEGRILTRDHRMAWLSAGKPITAAAILQLVEAGRLRLDGRLSDHLPAFGVNGKETVTVRHLLTHTAGLQPQPTRWPRLDWNAVIERICSGKLRHGATPGETAAYDPQRTWFLLGQLLQTIGGEDFETVVQVRICRPLGNLRSRWTSPGDAPENHSPLHVCDGETCEVVGQIAPVNAAPSPGSSYVAPAQEVGRFYEMLLAGGTLDGATILSRDSVAQMVSRQRRKMFDRTFQHVVDFGLGVIIDSNRYGPETVPYGFGRHCSQQTFGHGGAECAIAFADPKHQLVVALAFNGRPGETPHQQRNREICSAIYRDLGLA